MCTIESIVSYGKKYGYTHLGLVDRNVLAGAMAFKKACEKASIKPVYGLEFDLEAEERITNEVTKEILKTNGYIKDESDLVKIL